MKTTISGEEIFSPTGTQFAIAPTSCGYTLAYSVDGETFDVDENAVVAAGKNLFYIGAVPGALYKLSGNTDEDVQIIK